MFFIFIKTGHNNKDRFNHSFNLTVIIIVLISRDYISHTIEVILIRIQTGFDFGFLDAVFLSDGRGLVLGFFPRADPVCGGGSGTIHLHYPRPHLACLLSRRDIHSRVGATEAVHASDIHLALLSAMVDYSGDNFLCVLRF